MKTVQSAAIVEKTVGLTQEALLKIWFDQKPTAKSAYGLYGHPPMWETLKDGDLTLFTRPGKTSERVYDFGPYVEVDGVHYEWQRDGKWVGQGCQCSFKHFETHGPSKYDIPPLPIIKKPRTRKTVS